MIFFQKETAYMRCLSALLAMTGGAEAGDIAKELLPLIQDYTAFDAARYILFRKTLRAHDKEGLLAEAFRGMGKEKKNDDYRYYLPKIEYYLSKLHLLILRNETERARRLSELLHAFPSAYYRNDSEAMRTILRNELLSLFDY